MKMVEELRDRRLKDVVKKQGVIKIIGDPGEEIRAKSNLAIHGIKQEKKF